MMDFTEMKSATGLSTVNNPALNLNSLAKLDDALNVNKNVNLFKKDEKRSSLSIDFSQPQSMKKRLLRNSNYFNTYNTNTFDIITPIHEKNDITLQTPDVIKCLLGSPETEDFVRNAMSITPIQPSPLASFKLFESLDFNANGLFSPTSDFNKLPSPMSFFVNSNITNDSNQIINSVINNDAKQSESTKSIDDQLKKDKNELNEISNQALFSDKSNKGIDNQAMIINDKNEKFEIKEIKDLEDQNKAKQIEQNSSKSQLNSINNSINNSISNSISNSPTNIPSIKPPDNFINGQQLTSSTPQIAINPQQQNNLPNYLPNNMMMQFPPRIGYPPHPMSHLMNNPYPVPPNLSAMNSNPYTINSQVNHFYNQQLSVFNRSQMIDSANRSRNLTDSSASSSDSQTSTDDKKETTTITKMDESGNKIDDKKLRNRLAAARCRERKQKRVNQLEEQLRMVMQERNHYKDLYWKLEQQWVQHINNGCNSMEGIKK